MTAFALSFAVAMLCVLVSARPLSAQAGQVGPTTPPGGTPPGGGLPDQKPRKGQRVPPKLTMIAGWSTMLPARPSDPAVTDESRLYLALRSGDVVGVSLDKGEILWKTSVGASGGAAAGDALVFVPSGGSIIALDAASGKTVWKMPTAGRISARPVWRPGGVVVTLENGDVQTLAAASGQPLWTTPLHSASRRAAVVSGPHMYVALADRRIVALETSSGKPVWETVLAGAATLLYPDDDRLFVGGEDRFLYCLSESNGKVKWRWRTGGTIVGTGAVDNDRFYFVSYDNVLRALNRSNGNQQWKTALTLRPSDGPYLSGGLLLVVGAAAEVPAYNPKDGKSAGSVKMPEEPAVTPLLLPSADGTLGKLIVASGEGRLVQLVPGIPPLPSKSITGLLMFPPFPWDVSYAIDIEG